MATRASLQAASRTLLPRARATAYHVRRDDALRLIQALRKASTVSISSKHGLRGRRQCYIPASRSYATTMVKVPTMAESISEGTLKQWAKEVGDHVEQDEEIATIETDKIDVAVNAPEAGTIKKFLVNEDDTVTVGQEIVELEPGSAGSGSGKQEAKSEAKAPAPEEQSTASHPDPAEKNDAKTAKDESAAEPQPPKSSSYSPAESTSDKGAEASKPPPTQEPKAPQPSKAEDDSNQGSKKPRTAAEPSQPPSKADSDLGSRAERRVKMNRMRLRIAERLKQSQNTAAALTTFNEVDMSSIMDFRKLYKDEVLKNTGVKLGFMSAFAKACILAMKDVPAVNASIEGPNGGDTIVYRDYVDISVAVATEKGLVTPVVRNAESLSMVGIEKAIANLGKKARDNKLTIEDMAGGTFTISNGGVFGSLMGTPIINLPQTAVLGLHAIKQRPMAVNDKIEIRPMMYLALTYDHRLLDGREAVTFLVKIKEYIEDPRKMLLH